MTFAAQDSVSIGEETSPHQRNRALGAGEARLMPLAILKWDVLPSSKTWRAMSQRRTYVEPPNPTRKHKYTLLSTSNTSVLPVIGLLQASHFLAYRLPKHLRQYGVSSLEVKCWPASCVLQLVHTKHSLCQGSSRYVTPPLASVWKRDGHNSEGGTVAFLFWKHSFTTCLATTTQRAFSS